MVWGGFHCWVSFAGCPVRTITHDIDMGFGSGSPFSVLKLSISAGLEIGTVSVRRKSSFGELSPMTTRLV